MRLEHTETYTSSKTRAFCARMRDGQRCRDREFSRYCHTKGFTQLHSRSGQAHATSTLLAGPCCSKLGSYFLNENVQNLMFVKGIFIFPVVLKFNSALLS